MSSLDIAIGTRMTPTMWHLLFVLCLTAKLCLFFFLHIKRNIVDSLSIRFFFLFLSALPKKRELNFRLPGIESIVKIANLKKKRTL